MDTNAIKNWIIVAFAAVGSGIANILGGWDSALQTLLVFMAIDYLTGIVLAGVFKKSKKTEHGALESRTGFKGIVRKFSQLLVVLVAVYLDKLVGGSYIRTAAIIFFCANEGISILENVGLMGVPYPKFLKDALEVLRKKSDEGQVE